MCRTSFVTLHGFLLFISLRSSLPILPSGLCQLIFLTSYDTLKDRKVIQLQQTLYMAEKLLYNSILINLEDQDIVFWKRVEKMTSNFLNYKVGSKWRVQDRDILKLVIVARIFYVVLWLTQNSLNQLRMLRPRCFQAGWCGHDGDISKNDNVRMTVLLLD